ncbi:hypothetical protein BKN38_09160 [Helicobacter sp. CLO-3]|uniref:hypothetical protein n=1 Tax=unclassified Helicobacter TaxID=2593540 RepID=UPI0008049901|nr:MULTISPECIES: hypothetical protein [unclassified Helicobacter]OBV28738.1 hypothetical protein BA723_08250 [Helicobacter sp. CLO-3]OHU81390.1 hypothetical protein BKN38_09160 [Helicobacter sp. CLO-3]
MASENKANKSAPSGDSVVFLAQTDTTAGFLSSDYRKLNAIKKRDVNQKVLLTLSDYQNLKARYRIPRAHRRRVRYARQTSFILPNGKSFRVVKDSRHLAFLRHFGALYSTSANVSGGAFDLAWAMKQADIIVLDSRRIYEAKPSQIIKLSRKTKIQRKRG